VDLSIRLSSWRVLLPFRNAWSHLQIIFLLSERRLPFAIRRQFSFEDRDLDKEERISTNEDGDRLDQLAKELAKAKNRLKEIIDTMHDQRNILLAVASKSDVDIGEEDITSNDGHH